MLNKYSMYSSLKFKPDTYMPFQNYKRKCDIVEGCSIYVHYREKNYGPVI